MGFRLAICVLAAAAWSAPALSYFAPSDELGLVAFPSSRHRDAGVGSGPATRRHLGRVRAALESLEPAGGTPLYDTIAEGVAKQKEGWEAGAVNALVILTDGDEHGSERDLEDLELSLSAADETRTAGSSRRCSDASAVLA